MVPIKRHRRRIGHPGKPTSQILAPNDVWSADYKGQFRTSNGQYCYPLAWWVRLGILPELIEPGRPAQNGRHERMHRTLEAEATRPAAGSLAAQQRKFNVFREEFNQDRPHEALDQETPAACYTSSPRVKPDRIPPLEYPDRFEVRYVSANGGIRWNNRWVNVSIDCVGEYVGLEEIADGIWNVYFGPLRLGRLHERRSALKTSAGDSIVIVCNPCPWTRLLPISPTVQLSPPLRETMQDAIGDCADSEYDRKENEPGIRPRDPNASIAARPVAGKAQDEVGAEHDSRQPKADDGGYCRAATSTHHIERAEQQGARADQHRCPYGSVERRQPPLGDTLVQGAARSANFDLLSH